MTSISDEKRIALIRVFTCAFFAVGVLMSWTLWHSGRLFPLCPVFDFIPASTKGFDDLLPALLILFFILGAVLKKRWVFRTLFFVLIFLLLQDQIRWQPWVYLYVFMLLPFVVKKENDPKLISYFQILIIGVYLWSGLHKFNAGFLESTFDKMLEHLFFIDNPETRLSLHPLGYFIPIIEVGMAVALVFRKTRTLGVITVLITHVCILTYLIKSNHNSVVYPWNVAMMCFTFLLFYKNSNALQLFKLKDLKIKILSSVAALLFIIMPAFGIFKLWDTYLSFKLYSGSNGHYFVALDQDQAPKVDEYIYDFFWNVNRVPDKYWIYLNKWAIEELNVPFYPEMRTFKQVSKSFCNSEIPREKLRFYKLGWNFDTDPAVEFGCEECE